MIVYAVTQFFLGTVLQAGRLRFRFPMESLGFVHCLNPSGRTLALESTQSLTEVSTRNISWWVEAASRKG
jgi:hypothetical protein